MKKQAATLIIVICLTAMVSTAQAASPFEPSDARSARLAALGLCNDHDLYSDSIIYGRWTETQAPCDVDWLMLNMLYSPHVSPGMTYEEVRAIYLPLITR